MPKKKSFTFSDALFAAMAILCENRRYRNLTEFITALVRFDAQTLRDHVMTEEWAALSGEERDRLDAGLLERVKQWKPARGSWLMAKLEAIIKIVLEFVQAGKEPTPELVAKELAKREKPPKHDNGH